jgi:hypothetical protein
VRCGRPPVDSSSLLKSPKGHRRDACCCMALLTPKRVLLLVLSFRFPSLGSCAQCPAHSGCCCGEKVDGNMARDIRPWLSARVAVTVSNGIQRSKVLTPGKRKGLLTMLGSVAELLLKVTFPAAILPLQSCMHANMPWTNTCLVQAALCSLLVCFPCLPAVL